VFARALISQTFNYSCTMSSTEVVLASSDSQAALAQMQQSFRVQPQRWLMLALFSAMAVGNNLVWYVFATLHQFYAVDSLFDLFSIQFYICAHQQIVGRGLWQFISC
jgi:hypothetical protein